MLHKPKYENSTTKNVTPTTSNHHLCHHHKLGAKDGPDSKTRREGAPDCLVRGGKSRDGWEMVKKKRCPAH